MVAVRIGPDMRMAVVGAPRILLQTLRLKRLMSYKIIADQHAFANCRWALPLGVRARRKPLRVKVDGQLTCSPLPERMMPRYQGLGSLVSLKTWFRSNRVRQAYSGVTGVVSNFSWVYLYYPSRKQHPPAFALLIDAFATPNNGSFILDPFGY